MKYDWKNEPVLVLADSLALALAKARNAPLVSSDHHEFEPIQQADIARFVWIR